MSESAGVVDWGVASRLGKTMAGAEPEQAPDAGHARRTCDLALRRVIEYTDLDPTGGIPEVELIGRREWIDTNLHQLRELATPLEDRAADEIGLPWPLGGVVRGALGAAAGAEAGVLVGYASRRVLGQYQVALTPEPSPPRMLLVAGNLGEAAAKMKVDADRFLLWVAIHEQTHSVQFAAVPWLRDHLAGMVGRLLESAAGGIDLDALKALGKRLVSEDPRNAFREALRGELARTLAGPEQAAILDDLQATMAVIEGYAEHVMDAAPAANDGLADMRWAMDQRRKQATGIGDLIAKALGMGMKMRQYELGKAWSDAVASEGGIAGLNRVWDSRETLPSLAELETPDLWLERMSPRAPA